MTTMDTRVGPGADISDEDLDFAVGVKLRLDAGEEVPDADLDRAVAIKLKHFPPAAPPAPATTTVRGLMGPQQIPHVAVPAPTPDQTAAQQGQLLQDLNARYGNPDAPPNPSNVSLGEGGYTAQPPQRGMLSEMGNAFQAGVQGLEAGIGRAGAAVGDVARGLGFDALGAHLQQGRSGGLVPAAGAPSQLPEGTNPAYALAYKGARTFAGFAPVGGAAYLTGGLSGMGGVAGMLAGASPLAAAAGGDGYQAAVDAGLGEHRALQVGLAQAAVAELAGATQLGSVLSKYPWLRQGVQSLAEKRVAEYLAARGADATFQGAVGVAQLAANDAIHVASGLNPGAFENFWTEQAPAAFGENAFIAGAAGGLHDVAALPGAIRQRQQAAQLPAEYAAAREVARQTAPPNTTPAVQVRVEGPPAPVVNPNRPAPPPADGGPAAVAPPAPAGSPDQPTARVPGEGGADFSAAEALAARMAGERTPPSSPKPPEVFNPPAASQDDGQSAPTPPAEQPIKVGERVQWTSQGVAQFPEPRKVEGFATWTDGRRYAKLEGSNTMVPVDELGRPMPPKPAEPPPPAPRTQFTPRAPQPPREPAARPEMGSGRLNIPLTPEMEAQRQQETVNRNVEGWQREKALRDRPVPVPKVADEAPQPEASQARRTEEQGAQQPEPPKPSTPPPTAEDGAESQSGQPRDSKGEPSQEGTNLHILDEWQNSGKGGPSAWPKMTAERRRELEVVLGKMPTARGPVHRGLTGKADEIPAFLKSFAADPSAPSSWSNDESIADTYAARGGRKGNLLHGVIWTLGHDGSGAVKDVSAHPSEWTENEAVLAGGTKPTVEQARLSDESRSDIEAAGENPDDYEPSTPGWENRLKTAPIGLLYEVKASLKAKPAPHPAASDERARVHQEVKDAFGDQGESSPDGTPKAKEPWEMTVADAKLTDQDPIPPNHDRDGPWSGKTPPLGTYKIERNFEAGRGVVQKLVEIDPHEVGITEDEGEGRRWPGFDNYVQWAREGRTPPPITVVWNQPTKRWVSTNRRRVLAARDAGVTKMLAWRDEIHPDGSPVKHREAVEAAIKAGKPVPPEVLADFPDLAKPAPHPAASDERARVHQEVKDAFGDQGEAALPLLDAYARSWTRATGRPAGEFFGRFTFQKGGEDAGSMNKGSYRLLEDGRAVIRALSNPDASTLPHELGHAFLDFLHEIDPKLHADAMKALGAEGEPTVENHEKWSRAFEAYLREGKAPSSILRATFERFKAWLRDVYKSITRGPLAKKLTPDLRQVFNEMLTRGDAPESKPREVGKRRSQPVERREWSKADLADRLEHKYTNSPTYQADLSQDHIDLDRGTAGDFSGMYRFPGKIPTELTEALDGRPDLLKLLKANSPGPGAVGADYLGEMGTEKYIRKLEGDTRRRTKDVVESLRRDSADPEAMFLADLWESTPKGGGAPKETVKAEDLAEQGLKFTIDGRNAAIIKKGGDLHLRVKGLGSYPLVAFDEVPVDRGSLARGARGTELHQAAQEPEKTTPKLLDAVTHLAIKTAQRGIRGLKVTERDATVALDRFIGHGEYGPAVTTRAARMANTLLRRSQNKFGGIDPARLEANIGKAYTVAKNRAHREALRQTEVGRAMEVRAMERKGEAKVEKLKTLLTEKGLQAAREMAQEKRDGRERLIRQAGRFLKKGLKERLQSEQRGSVEGYRAGQQDLQAVRREAANIVLKGIPRGERGRSKIIQAIREATRTKDIYRLVQEVQHRAVSARAAEAWKAIRKMTKGKGVSSMPEATDQLPGFVDGFPLRAHTKKLLAEAKLAKDVAANQKAEPVRQARLLNQRTRERRIIKDKTSTPLQKALARDVLRQVNEKLRDLRPDLQPKIDAANRLAEISKEIREAKTAVKRQDDVYINNERKGARWLRKNAMARLELAPRIGTTALETKPGVTEGSTQTLGTKGVFLNWTPDTLGQWMDNAIGSPEQAQFSHHLLFKEPLRAQARVAAEKVQRLADLDKLAERHGFDSFDHATAVISGTHGGGLQETVDIDVPGWVDKKITMGEALKIFGDDQDETTRELSDDGMAHRLARRRDGHVTGLDASNRAEIINAIPQRFRDFYTDFKALKERSLGGRALELRRRYKGTAPDMIPNREPRVREGDSDYQTDYFDSKSQNRSLLEQSFMKDRVQSPGPVNLIVDGLESHMKDWDSQLHLIHHADLANALAKTLLHKDMQKALAVHGGEQALERVETLVHRILGTELKGKPTALDAAARALRKNVGAGMTALSPRSFVKQFSVIPLLASLHPREAAIAAAHLGQKGLRERVMAANGLLAQRFHMADAAKAASAGMSNPIFDSGDFKLRMAAGWGNLKDAAVQAGRLQVRNATRNVLRALGNLRDGTTNALRFNSWADEQGVKLAFLINEQIVDREHPHLNKAEREQLIGEKTAEMVYRTMNTYDVLGQSFWRSDLDQRPLLGLANMFSNDSTKQANLLYQAARSGQKGLKARVAAGLALGSAWSVLAPFALTLVGGYAWRKIAGGSETDIERAKELRDQLSWNAVREAGGKLPIIGSDLLIDIGRIVAEGKGDLNASGSPATQAVGQLVRETALGLYNTWSDQDDPNKTGTQNFEAAEKKAGRRADNLSAALRAGGTVAGVGLMPVINLLRSMKPEAEPYGLAANWATRGDEDKAADILAERVAAMQKVGLEDDEIKKHLVEVMTSRLNRDVEKDDRETRLDNAATARRLVSEAMNR